MAQLTNFPLDFFYEIFTKRCLSTSSIPWCKKVKMTKNSNRGGSCLKGEVRRKMNFTHVLGFVVLRDVVKVFPVSSSSFARKTTGRNRAQSHSGV